MRLEKLVWKTSMANHRSARHGSTSSAFPFLFKDFVYLLLEREGERQRGRERSACKRYIYWLPLTRPQLGYLTCNLGMCPDWELNWQSFSSQAGAQSTEPHQPGHHLRFFIKHKQLAIWTILFWRRGLFPSLFQGQLVLVCRKWHGGLMRFGSYPDQFNSAPLELCSRCCREKVSGVPGWLCQLWGEGIVQVSVTSWMCLHVVVCGPSGYISPSVSRRSGTWDSWLALQVYHVD